MDINLDLLDLVIGISLALLSGISYLIKQKSEYNKASKFINFDMNGLWYSAELDFKQKKLGNAFLKVELKRKKLGNRIKIKPREQVNDNKVEYLSSWHFDGRISPDNTVIGEYVGLNNHSLGQGAGFLQFIGHGRAVGYWVGYSGKYSGQPMYGYWILSRNEVDVKEMADFVLTKFQYFDIKFLVEHMSEKISSKDYLKKSE